MRLFQNLHGEMHIVNGELSYMDTYDNYIKDGGSIEYNFCVHDDSQKFCQIEDEFFPFPVEEFDIEIEKTSTLLEAKVLRERDEKTLEQYKEEKIFSLKIIRDEENSSILSFDGHKFDFDSVSREKIQNAIDLLEYKESMIWIDAENCKIEVNKEYMKRLLSCGASRSNDLCVKYNELKYKVNSCQTKDEVDLVVW